jgi:hypothetical protein
MWPQPGCLMPQDYAVVPENELASEDMHDWLEHAQ